MLTLRQEMHLIPFPLDPDPNLPGKHLAAIIRAAARVTSKAGKAFAKPYRIRAYEIVTGEEDAELLPLTPATPAPRRRGRPSWKQ